MHTVKGPRPLAEELYAKVRTLRKIRKMSVQVLADKMTAQGYPISRAYIACCETGRVRNMSVDFADHAARALGITLVQFIAEPADCGTCKGDPPAGFACTTCGQTGGAA